MSSEWPVVRLGDYCLKIGSGATPRGGKSVYLDAGETTLIRSQNIYNDGFTTDGLVYITKSAADKLNNVEVLAGDILLNITGDSVARVCIAPTEYLPARVNQHVSIIRPNPDDFDARFLRYFLVSPEQQELLLVIASSGATRNALTKGHIESLEISKPSLAIQTGIADQLETLDKKIEINQQINQTLEQMAQAIFKSWFVDFEPVKAKMAALEAGGSEDDALLAAMQAIAGNALFASNAADADAATQLARLQAEHPEQYATLRATAELFPSAMQESELGEIPEGWSVCQIENILDRLKPVKRYTKKEVSLTGLVPVFEQGADILLGFHNENAGFTADAKNPAFVFGDHTCITHLSCQDFDISQNVIPLRGRSRPTIWVYYAIQGKQVFQEYRRHWSELIVKPVIYPTNDLCEQYSETVLKMIFLKENLERENKTLSELRDTLLPKLLSGELSVAEAE